MLCKTSVEVLPACLSNCRASDEYPLTAVVDFEVWQEVGMYGCQSAPFSETTNFAATAYQGFSDSHMPGWGQAIHLVGWPLVQVSATALFAGRQPGAVSCRVAQTLSAHVQLLWSRRVLVRFSNRRNRLTGMRLGLRLKYFEILTFAFERSEKRWAPWYILEVVIFGAHLDSINHISPEPRVFCRGLKPGTSEAPSLQLMHEAMSIDLAVHRDQIAQDNARNSKVSGNLECIVCLLIEKFRFS